ncbi:MAG: hypothetical protein AAF515_05680 [Pseudomonadota bacterium]
MLIRPDASWSHWDDSAERVHGVTRGILREHGRPIAAVCDALNDLLGDHIAYSDGWGHDKPWLITLFHAARIDMRFRVSPLELLLSEPQMSRWHDVRDRIEAEFGERRHRASADAWVVQQTFLRTRVESAKQLDRD